MAYRVIQDWRNGAGDVADLQENLAQARAMLQEFPMVAALKLIKAGLSGDLTWLNVAPPWVPLPADRKQDLKATLADLTRLVPELDKISETV